MFKKQGYHYFSLIILLVSVYLLATGDVLSGQLWGISTQTWLWIAVTTPVLHQIVVALVWRAELYHHKMTDCFGDSAFPIYKVIFSILFVGRPITLILLGISNAGTLNINPTLAYVLAGILFIPAAYTMYSVLHYFGINRAYGEDHFKPDEYKNKPFVKQGMFKYTDNAMYKFAFLLLWALALVFLSKAALLVAAFNHLYIWVHFYFTELPDIQYIYADRSKESA
ncbi:MAG TPA: methyltransferase [Anaerolineales bacterium]|nr:methyltransferase [Anaerolineales bacterium]